MNELQYLRLMAEAPKVCFDAFNETHHAQHAAELLASIADIKRLKPEWKEKLRPIENAEAFVAQVGSQSLWDAAKYFDLSALVEKTELLESLSSTDFDEDQP